MIYKPKTILWRLSHGRQRAYLAKRPEVVWMAWLKMAGTEMNVKKQIREKFKPKITRPRMTNI